MSFQWKKWSQYNGGCGIGHDVIVECGAETKKWRYFRECIPRHVVPNYPYGEGYWTTEYGYYRCLVQKPRVKNYYQTLDEMSRAYQEELDYINEKRAARRAKMEANERSKSTAREVSDLKDENERLKQQLSTIMQEHERLQAFVLRNVPGKMRSEDKNIPLPMDIFDINNPS